MMWILTYLQSFFLQHLVPAYASSISEVLLMKNMKNISQILIVDIIQNLPSKPLALLAQVSGKVGVILW